MLEPASRAWARTQQEERERQEEEERQERLRQEQEERERMNCEQEEARRKEEEKLQQDDKARREWRRAEESAREARKREQEICHHMPLYFQKWHQRWTAAFAEGSITVFPHPPQFVCICKEVSCVVQKNEQGALLACRPDMKRLLEASGPYSSRWLRQESLNFHPDRVRQCSVSAICRDLR